MMLKLQKRLAASVLGCSEKRVVFDPARLEDIKEAITKTDIRLLIGEGAIRAAPKKGVSRIRANKRLLQKRKGLRRGLGSRKGKFTARESKKQTWMNRVRSQRKFLRALKEQLQKGAFRKLYLKSKGGFFRSVKHIKLYIDEHDLTVKPLQKPGAAEQKSEEKSKEKKPAQKKATPKKESKVNETHD